MTLTTKKHGLTRIDSGWNNWLILVLGLSLCWFFLLQPIWRWRTAANWEEVPAEIVGSELDGEPARQVRGGTRSGTGRAIVVFRYEYQKQRYTSDRYGVLPVAWGVLGDAPSKILAAYPSDAKVSALVNPDRPAEAMLQRRFPFAWLMLPGYGGLVLAGVGIFRIGKRNVTGWWK